MPSEANWYSPEQSQRGSNPCLHLEREGGFVARRPSSHRDVAFRHLRMATLTGRDTMKRSCWVDCWVFCHITLAVINDSRYYCRCDPVVPRQGDRADLEQAACPPARQWLPEDRPPETSDPRCRRCARRPESPPRQSTREIEGRPRRLVRHPSQPAVADLFQVDGRRRRGR